MIKITSRCDLQEIKQSALFPYISALLDSLLKKYADFCPNDSIEIIGAIYIPESHSELKNDYKLMGLDVPLSQAPIEWTEEHKNFYNICIVISTDYAINIITDKIFLDEDMINNIKKGGIIDEQQ